jgi:CO/xanthine dehydrogenase Mo-binding subunit
VPTGAFRGFGAPQAFFAVEMHMEQLARELEQDPLDFKISHALVQGDQTSTEGRIWQDVKLPEMVARLEEMSDYRRKHRAASRGQRRDGSALKGIGASLFFHGCGFTGHGEQAIIKGKATLVKRPDDRVEILVASVDMGQGVQTTLAKIVAETLGIPLEQVIYENPDTDRVPDSGPTVASRTVMVVGRLLERAAQEMKANWHPGEETEVTISYAHPDFVQWDQDTFKGDAYPTYAWGANAVEVEVDPLTLEIDVCGAWGVYDVGVPIDERIVDGQIEGGLAQGLGYATIEVMEIQQGRILQRSLTDYIVPTAKDVPCIQSALVLNPYEHGPFGAKGVGELPLVGAAPALAAAVQTALGIPISEIPVTPESLLEQLQDGGVGQPAS